MLNRYTTSDFEKIKMTAKFTPEKLDDQEFLNELNESLSQKYSYLVVRNGKNISFNGSHGNKNILKSLAEYGSTEPDSGTGSYIEDKYGILVKQADFQNVNGEDASAFIITSMEGTVPEMRRFVIGTVVAIVLILLLTAFMMIFWTYRSLITPIRKLQVAAENVRDGNLDFSVDGGGEDEIGLLQRDMQKELLTVWQIHLKK